MGKINIGILGTAHITYGAVLIPAKFSKSINVAAVASRDLDRAKSYAKKHHIRKFYGNYEDLIQDSEIDIIYNPLPNSLHKEWSIRALKAGKSVLCEKPIAANAQDAMEMKQVADETGLLLVEGFHNLYHPITRRIKEILDSQTLGTIQNMEFNFYVNAIPRSNIRFQSDLAGGSLMDLGCYGINLFRYLCHEEPKVLSANAICQNPEIDDEMMAELQFPNHNISGTIKCSLIADHFDQRLKIIGTKGEMEISRPVNPILFQKIVIKKGNSKNKIGVFGNLTWIYQMRAFVNALKTKEPMLSSIEDGILNMQVIDTIYRKAGLQQRESSNTI